MLTFYDPSLEMGLLLSLFFLLIDDVLCQNHQLFLFLSGLLEIEFELNGWAPGLKVAKGTFSVAAPSLGGVSAKRRLITLLMAVLNM